MTVKPGRVPLLRQGGHPARGHSGQRGEAQKGEPDVKRDKPWIIRTYAGHSTAAESNALYRGNLARGRPACRSPSTCRPRPATTPTTSWRRGEVGKVGVSIAHLGDMRTLFQDIPLSQMNTSMTINATAPWLLALYLAVAEEQGARSRPSRARPRTTSSRIPVAGHLRLPPGPSLRLTKDVILFTTSQVPKWNPMNVCSYHLQEAGATPVQELSYALAWPSRCSTRCATTPISTRRASPTWSGDLVLRECGMRFVTEICKMRAFSDLWDEITRDRYGITDEGSASSATACR